MANSLGQSMYNSDLEHQYNYQAALTWLLIVVVAATLASIIPARNAARIIVRDSLSYK